MNSHWFPSWFPLCRWRLANGILDSAAIPAASGRQTSTQWRKKVRKWDSRKCNSVLSIIKVKFTKMKTCRHLKDKRHFISDLPGQQTGRGCTFALWTSVWQEAMGEEKVTYVYTRPSFFPVKMHIVPVRPWVETFFSLGSSLCQKINNHWCRLAFHPSRDVFLFYSPIKSRHHDH